MARGNCGMCESTRIEEAPNGPNRKVWRVSQPDLPLGAFCVLEVNYGDYAYV